MQLFWVYIAWPKSFTHIHNINKRYLYLLLYWLIYIIIPISKITFISYRMMCKIIFVVYFGYGMHYRIHLHLNGEIDWYCFVRKLPQLTEVWLSYEMERLIVIPMAKSLWWCQDHSDIKRMSAGYSWKELRLTHSCDVAVKWIEVYFLRPTL